MSVVEIVLRISTHLSNMASFHAKGVQLERHATTGVDYMRNISNFIHRLVNSRRSSGHTAILLCKVAGLLGQSTRPGVNDDIIPSACLH